MDMFKVGVIVFTMELVKHFAVVLAEASISFEIKVNDMVVTTVESVDLSDESETVVS